MMSSMRIGTWNLAGNWSPAHEAFIQKQNCDVWLLTEVPETIRVKSYTPHLSRSSMLPGKRWAGVLSRTSLQMVPLEDPHPASAAAVVGDTTFVSSILPWRSCGSGLPWIGKDTAEKTRAVLDELLKNLPMQDLVWGGDWNHSLEGTETAGSSAGRDMIVAALEELDLCAPTAHLDHRLPGVMTIDHIAVSRPWSGPKAEHVPALREDGTALSDHDAYVVEVN